MVDVAWEIPKLKKPFQCKQTNIQSIKLTANISRSYSSEQEKQWSTRPPRTLLMVSLNSELNGRKLLLNLKTNKNKMIRSKSFDSMPTSDSIEYSLLIFMQLFIASYHTFEHSIFLAKAISAHVHHIVLPYAAISIKNNKQIFKKRQPDKHYKWLIAMGNNTKRTFCSLLVLLKVEEEKTCAHCVHNE